VFLGVLGMILRVKGHDMKAPKQNCPRCNAEQSFRPRHRDTPTPGRQDRVIEVFIKCTVCNWESVLRKSTPGIEVLYDRRRRLLEVARQQKTRHGAVNGSTSKLIANANLMLGTARREAGLDIIADR
jgi:hypothetical protein